MASGKGKRGGKWPKKMGFACKRRRRAVKYNRLKKGSLPVPDANEINSDMEIKQNIKLVIKEEPAFIKTEIDIDLQSPLDVDDVKTEFPQYDFVDTGNFFNSLFSTCSLFGLEQHWGIHSCNPNDNKIRPCMVLLTEPKPRSIVFSQVSVREGIPISGKQVVLYDDFNINYFVGHNAVDHPTLPKFSSSLESLQMAINDFSKFRMCKGGPSCTEYAEVSLVTKCAYRDYSSLVWRHNLCGFFAEDGFETCAHCIFLPRYFKVALKKSKTLQWLRKKMGSDVENWKTRSPIVINM